MLNTIRIVMVCLRGSTQMRAYAQNPCFFGWFFFWRGGSYISNRSINQKTVRSCENPLSETDGGICSFCIPEIVQMSESSWTIIYWCLNDEYPVYSFIFFFIVTIFFNILCFALLATITQLLTLLRGCLHE